YERFLKVVGEGRGLDRDYIDSIAQGRVWIAKTAKDLKLVDNLGDLDAAIASAAAKAGLEQYDVVEMTETVTPFQRLFGKMSAQAMKAAGLGEGKAFSRASALKTLIAKADEQLAFFNGFNDPNGVYARCLACEGR
ncbi:MAG: S49 family peptidase, partial [Amphiplicatus sp.]